MNQILNKRLKIAANFNIMFRNTKEFCNSRNSAGVTTTNPVYMKLFRSTVIIHIRIVSGESPLLKLGFYSLKNFHAIIVFSIWIKRTSKNFAFFSVSHE